MLAREQTYGQTRIVREYSTDTDQDAIVARSQSMRQV